MAGMGIIVSQNHLINSSGMTAEASHLLPNVGVPTHNVSKQMCRVTKLFHSRPLRTLRPGGLQSRGDMLRFFQPQHSVKGHSPGDLSLRLPPLQTTIAFPGVVNSVASFSQQSESSPESIVKAIPVLNKIKLLAKISPPLDLPLWSLRGPVISVDGQDPILVKTMFDYLNSALQIEGKYNVQAFEGPNIGPHKPSSESRQMGNTIADYLHTVSAWHQISDGIRRFVQPSTEFFARKPTKDFHLGVSSKTITPEITNLLRSSTQPSVSNSVTSQSSAVSDRATPLALVPRYQLTTADAYACSVPICDLYRPLDHWQWMASLWRACVGSDITVYIHEYKKDELVHLGGNLVEVYIHEARAAVVLKAEGCEGLEDKVLKQVRIEIMDLLAQ